MPPHVPSVPISWTLIVRNCGPAAVVALRSLRPFLLHRDDEVVVVDTGSTDDTVERLRGARLGRRLRVIRRPDLCDAGLPERMRALRPRDWERFGSHPQFDGGCLADFAAARQAAHEAARNPVVAWLDADDVLEGDLPTLRKEVDNFFGARRGECFFLRYDYSHDEDGCCTTVLWRERFVLRDLHRWVGKCHEVLLPTKNVLGAIARSETGWIRHVREHRKQHEFSDLRNYAILRGELDAAGSPDKVDPRVLYYLGNACRGLRDFREAEYYYRHFLPRSGSRDDRVLALLHLGQMYLLLGRPWRAMRYYQEAQLVHSGDPRPDFGLQRCCVELGRWEESIHWGQSGLRKAPEFWSLNSVDPQQLVGFPHYFLALAARELRQPEEAVKEAQAFARTRPGLAAAQDFLRHIERWAATFQQCVAVHRVLHAALSIPLRIKILQSIALPQGSEEYGLLRPEDAVYAPRGRPVTIYCGETAEAWGPDGERVGIGGSERMVIEMARRLAARGLDVSVYCKLAHLGQRAVVDGVSWRHYLEFNPTLPHGDLIIWRNPGALALAVPANRRYLWCHDITPDGAFTDVVRATMDRAIFLSPWARSLAPSLPDKKAYVSRNGVDVAAIEALGAVERRPRRVVYASSPDRGLHILLRAWELLAQRGELPEDAELEVLYGFTPHYMRVAAVNEYVSVGGVARHRLDLMEETLSTIDSLPRVRFRGRVSKEETLRTFLGAGVLCYPSVFDETFCLVAAEAQACGCAVIAPRRAALATTLGHGPLVSELESVTPEEVARALRAHFERDPAALDAERDRLASWARRRFDLEALADEWVRDLRLGVEE